MEYYGYVGRILYVDVTTDDVRKEPLDLELAQKFIGATGVNCRLAYDLLKPGTDPLSPSAPIIIGVGPLCGTLTPQCGKVHATYKLSTLASKREEKYNVVTGVGGNRRFGAMIKNAGYDHVVITGRAKKPSYLKIVDDDIEVCDASDLWGRSGIYETTDELAYRHKGVTGKAGVWAIGRAGENLLSFAVGFCDNENTLGRNGGAALLGSKNLKAVVSLGSKGIKIREPERFMALVDKKRQEIMAHPAFGTAGTPGFGVAPPEYKPEAARMACMACIEPCRSPHWIYPTPPSRIGNNCMIISEKLGIDYKDAVKLYLEADDVGVDIFSTIKILPFVTALYERGVISTKDTGGLVLRQGDFDCYLKLFHKFINRKDIGDIMAEGWYRLTQRVGVDASEDLRAGTSISKGVDTLIDKTDPTQVKLYPFSPMAGLAEIVRAKVQHVHQLTYVPRGEDIHRETYWPEWNASLNDLKRDCEKMGASKEEIDRIFTQEDANFGRLEKHALDAHYVYNSVGTCDASHSVWDPMRDVPLLAELYSAATGFKVTTRELKLGGERVHNLEKLLNVREGFTREDDAIPPVWLQMIDTPKNVHGVDHYLIDWFGRRITREDIYQMLDDFYEESGWDKGTSIPGKEKCRELGLEEFMGVAPGP